MCSQEMDEKVIILDEETAAALTLQKHIRSFLIKRKWVKLSGCYGQLYFFLVQITK